MFGIIGQDTIYLAKFLLNKKYFRPSEVYPLLGSVAKARKELKWKPNITFKELVNEMIENDLKMLESNDKKK